MKTSSLLRRPSPRLTRTLAQFGFACRGFIYLCLALLVLQIAGGRSHAKADDRGAFAAIARQPLGRILLFAVALGFVALALWAASRAARPAHGTDGWGRRVVAGAKVVLYLVLAGSAFAVVASAQGGSSSSGGDKEVVDFTGHLMSAPAGRILVGLVGLGVAIGGVVLGFQGLRHANQEEVDLNRASPRTRRLMEVAGMVGMAARGLIFALAGIFMLQAALSYNPGKAKGLDGVLRSLASAPAGPWILAPVAIGLASFGCFSIMETRYAKS